MSNRLAVAALASVSRSATLVGSYHRWRHVKFVHVVDADERRSLAKIGLEVVARRHLRWPVVDDNDQPGKGGDSMKCINSFDGYGGMAHRSPLSPVTKVGFWSKVP